jgi:hypothetical protein
MEFLVSIHVTEFLVSIQVQNKFDALPKFLDILYLTQALKLERRRVEKNNIEKIKFEFTANNDHVVPQQVARDKKYLILTMAR